MKLLPKSLVMLACAAGLAMPAQAQWEPERPIEFVIQTSPGGGSDIYTMDWDGRNVRRVTRGGAYVSPSWSPRLRSGGR